MSRALLLAGAGSAKGRLVALVREARQVARGHGVARLDVAFLAAKAVLFVLLDALGVGPVAAEAAVGFRLVAVCLEFVVDGDVKDVTFVGAEIVGVFLALCELSVQME